MPPRGPPPARAIPTLPLRRGPSIGPLPDPGPAQPFAESAPASALLGLEALLGLGPVRPRATVRLFLGFVRELLGDLGQFRDPLRQDVDVPAARHVQGMQRPRHPVLEHLLELVPGSGRPFLRIAEALVGGGLRPLLDLFAFGDQRLEHLYAFLLGLGEGSEPRKPDLIGGFPDLHSQLVFPAFSSEFLESLWHDHPRFISAANPPFYRMHQTT